MRVPEFTDTLGVKYKRYIIEPDEYTIRQVWGNYEEFEKIAVDSKGRRASNGRCLFVNIPAHYVVPIFQSGNRNIEFVFCDMLGGRTSFTEKMDMDILRIQTLENEVEILKIQVAKAHERWRDNVQQKTQHTHLAVDLAETNKLVGARPIEKIDSRISSNEGVEVENANE
jgi:hypothetical protein